MDSRDPRWERADALLDEALELSGDEREAFLDRECRDDAELRALVGRLLRHAETDESWPGATPPVDLTRTDDLVERLEQEASLVGKTVDRYRVVRELGQGGMAVVYLAERADGEFEQQVALKLIKRGVDTDEIIRRFSRERQIMAVARHPDIARLLDGGATEDGRPYFVMEYVDGRPIDRYCDERKLSVQDRLELFLRVARAVSYAHRNLVVHRDIKPTNILVSDDGDVKLLDFGIARYLGDEGDTRLTRTRQRFMTPAYASPEQVRGETVTTASDVYQLGLLLYRLLTGRGPYEADGSRPDSLVRAICEEPPTRPSTAVGRTQAGGTGRDDLPTPEEIGSRRASTPSGLKRELSGDLDNIILMALRKEPERRYASVDQLVEDIERYRSGLPVIARRDTFSYRASKFVGRHRVAVALAGIGLVMLVAFAVSMAVLAGRLARERDRANTAAATAETVSEFLVGLFEVSDPSEARGSSVTAREILDLGAERIESELADQPVVRAEMMDTIGRVYQNLGLYDSAQELLEEALRTRRTTLGETHPDTTESVGNVAWLLEKRGNYSAAEPLFRETLRDRQQRFGEESKEAADALNNLGLLLFEKGDYDEAEPMLRQAVDMRIRFLGENHEATADSLSNLGLLRQRMGRHEEAEKLFRRALDTRRGTLGEDHPRVAVSYDNLGRAYFSQKRYEESEEMLRKGLELRRKLYGNEHPETAESLNNLASLHFMRKNWDAAEPLFREAVALDRKLLGENHPDTAVTVNNLANVLQTRGRPDEALPLYLQAVEILETSLDPDHWLIAMGRGGVGSCLVALGRHAEAEPYALDSVEGMSAALGPDHPRTRRAIEGTVELYESWGKPAEAKRYRAMLPTDDDEPSKGE